MITADLIRQLIVDHDANRPRSKQKTLGPSDLGSPCPRKLVHQILDTPPVVEQHVSLQAWVGTSIHATFEQMLKDNPDWETEFPIAIRLGKGRVITGTCDLYHHPTRTVCDIKTVGPSALAKYRAKSPDRYLTQIAIYGLGIVLSGRWGVDNTALVYVPRNGDLADIHVDVHPWDQDRADQAVARYEQLHTAAQAGPQILPLLPTGDDCRFCKWWKPGTPEGQQDACPGHPPQNPHAAPAPWVTEEEKETASA